MRRGNDGGLFCHILETGAIGSHLFDKYRQSSTFFQRQNGPSPPIPARCSVPFCFTSFSFLSGGEKRTRAKAQEPAWAVPLRPSVGGSWFTRKIILRGFSFRKAPQGKTGNEWWERVVRWATFIPPLRFLFFGSFFSFSERKERTDLFPKEKERTATQKAVRGRAVSGRGSSRARWRSAGRGHLSGPGRCAPRAAPRRR